MNGSGYLQKFWLVIFVLSHSDGASGARVDINIANIHMTLTNWMYRSRLTFVPRMRETHPAEKTDRYFNFEQSELYGLIGTSRNFFINNAQRQSLNAWDLLYQKLRSRHRICA